jgi:hypothetical protein
VCISRQGDRATGGDGKSSSGSEGVLCCVVVWCVLLCCALVRFAVLCFVAVFATLSSLMCFSVISVLCCAAVCPLRLNLLCFSVISVLCFASTLCSSGCAVDQKDKGKGKADEDETKMGSDMDLDKSDAGGAMPLEDPPFAPRYGTVSYVFGGNLKVRQALQ